jgi:hypothetical protein
VIGRGYQPSADLHIDLFAQADMQRPRRADVVDCANLGRILSRAREPPVGDAQFLSRISARADRSAFNAPLNHVRCTN